MVILQSPFTFFSAVNGVQLKRQVAELERLEGVSLGFTFGRRSAKDWRGWWYTHHNTSSLDKTFEEVRQAAASSAQRLVFAAFRAVEDSPLVLNGCEPGALFTPAGEPARYMLMRHGSAVRLGPHRYGCEERDVLPLARLSDVQGVLAAR